MSKLNPQKASAYVGPGVLRKGGKITPVPNGPLIKKKGPFKGSTLKAGGTIKKAQNGTKEKSSKNNNEVKIGNKTYTTTRSVNDTTKVKPMTNWVTNPMPPSKNNDKHNRGINSLINRANRGYKAGGVIKKAQNGDTTKVSTLSPYMQKRAAQDLVKKKNMRAADSIVQRNANAKKMTREEYSDFQKKNAKKSDVPRYEIPTAKDERELARESNRASGPGFFDSLNALNPFKERAGCIYTDEDKSGVKKRNGGPVKKAKAGAMIKRADGSMSKRGLWDNIRANKGSGKKPTKQMLVQEKKIKAKSKK